MAAHRPPFLPSFSLCSPSFFLVRIHPGGRGGRQHREDACHGDGCGILEGLFSASFVALSPLCEWCKEVKCNCTSFPGSVEVGPALSQASFLWVQYAWEWWVLFERAGGGRFPWLLRNSHNLTLKTKECEVNS